MIAKVLQFLYRDLDIGPTEESDATVRDDGQGEYIIWRSSDPEPTQQEINDAENDLTVVDGQVFSEWLVENGGNLEETLKRKVREKLDSEDDKLSKLIVALAKVTMDEINILRNLHGLNPRSLSQLKSAIKNKLN